MATLHFKVLILGAGSGGISVAARLKSKVGAQNIGIVDPSDTHYYQPLWTLVGAGIVQKEQTKKPMESLIPRGIQWIRESIVTLQNDSKQNLKQVTCTSGLVITYDYLVVATGLRLNWEKIKGLEENRSKKIGTNGLCSIYQYEDAERTAKMIQEFKGGQAIFVMPPVPIKCAGAPQKIMYLADDIFRKNGVREKTQLTFTLAGKVIFGVPAFAKPLMEVVARKNIQLRFSHRLIEVKASEKLAVYEKTTDVFENGTTKSTTEQVTMPYDLLHVVPPMSAHDFISNSGLAFSSGPQMGWLKVDQGTLQHMDEKNVFGIGDVTGVPNSKTGAAIRKQAPVVVQNLCDVMAGQEPSARYDGYSSCPLVTGFGKVILAEFGYDGKLLPSFPMDMTQERKSMWVLKKDLLPPMYWHGMMKGWM